MDWSVLGYGPQVQLPPKYSVQISPGDGETKSGIYRAFRTQEFVMSYDPTIKTVFEALQSSVAKWGKQNFHGVKVGDAFQWRTYEEVLSDIQAFGSGLLKLNALAQDTTKEMKLLGLMGRNHSHWMIAEYGGLGFGATTVPFYDSLSPETLCHLINNCGLTTVVCDIPSAKKLIEAKSLGAASLNLLIIYAAEAAELSSLVSEGSTAQIKVLAFNDVLTTGQANLLPFAPPKPEQIYSFTFTSGSTGKFPKAALIRHSAALANVSSVMYEYDNTPNFVLVRAGEFHFSYLPIAHAMERTMVQFMFCIGGSVGFSSGVREKVLEELALLRPTIFISVPRILNRLHDKIMSTAQEAGGLKTKIFMAAYEAKKGNVALGYLKHPLYDALVFNPIKKKLGLDRCHLIVTGSAPISAEVLSFYRAVFGIPVNEGYGATEMTCIATGTYTFSMTSGHVGGPSVCAEVRLIAIPSMPHYKINDTKHGDLDVLGRGEICVRGPCIMREYYRNPEATKAAIDADGFYMSGDVAAILPDGTFKIIDRKNNIFKLSNGEYVSPEVCEQKIVRASLISQAYVYGDSLHARLVAICVVDPDTAIPYATQNNLPTDLKALCSNKAFYDHVIKEIEVTGKKEGLRGYEIPFKVHLEWDPFTDKNVLTATLKLQRTLAFAKYGDILKQMLGDEK